MPKIKNKKQMPDALKKAIKKFVKKAYDLAELACEVHNYATYEGDYWDLMMEALREEDVDKVYKEVSKLDF